MTFGNQLLDQSPQVFVLSAKMEKMVLGDDHHCHIISKRKERIVPLKWRKNVIEVKTLGSALPGSMALGRRVVTLFLPLFLLRNLPYKTVLRIK